MANRALCSISGSPCKCGTPESCQNIQVAKAQLLVRKAIVQLEEEHTKYYSQGEYNHRKPPLPEIRQIVRELLNAIGAMENL